MDSMRDRICSAFIFSVLICSFNTLIWPSRLPFSISAWFIWFRFSVSWSSSSATSRSSVSYASFKCSDSAFASCKSPETMDSLLLISCSCFPFSSDSIRNRFTSQVFNSSRKARYFFAVSDCLASGPTCFSSSERMSLTRIRFCFSSSSFFWAMALRRLNFTIPAASSKSSRRSSGLPLKILSIWP